MWANPQQLIGSGKEAELAQLLNFSVDGFSAKLNRYRNKQFMYLARHQTPTVARAVLSSDIADLRKAGVSTFLSGRRGCLSVGRPTNIDGAGASGVEMKFDDSLQGVPGKKRFIKDLHGDAIRDIGVVSEAADGESVQLSIDLRLQHVQHRELLRAIKETGAAAASAVTVDAHTGEILAMTNLPSFNPNRRGQLNLAAMRNRVVAGRLCSSLSTVKPLTLVAALESGEFDIDTIIDTSPGRIKVGDKVLPDPRNYGHISVSRY